MVKISPSFIKKILIDHPAFYYFFFLPAYLPPRMLGDAFPLYHLVMGDPLSRIRYFLYIMFQTAISGFSISLIVRFYSKQSNLSVEKLLLSMRSIGFIISVIFIFSTWGLLNPSSVTELYLISGIHYFCIAFLGNLVVIESKHYKLPRLSSPSGGINDAVMSSVMGFNINFLGIFSCAAAYLLITYLSVSLYSLYCVTLDVLLCLFLLIYKKYYKCFVYIIRNKNMFVKDLLFYFLGLIFCVVIAFLASITKAIVLLAVVAVYILNKNLKKEVDTKKVRCIFVTNFAYGTAFSLIITPLLLLTLPSEAFINSYAGVAILEPALGALMMFFILFAVTKNWLKSDFDSTKRLVVASSLLAVLLPVCLLLLSNGYCWFWVVLVYFVYSWVESTSRYVTTEITFSLQKDSTSIQTNFYGGFIYRGVVPMLYIAFTTLFSYVFSLSTSIIISNAIMVAATLGLCYNLNNF